MYVHTHTNTNLALFAFLVRRFGITGGSLRRRAVSLRVCGKVIGK